MLPGAVRSTRSSRSSWPAPNNEQALRRVAQDPIKGGTAIGAPTGGPIDLPSSLTATTPARRSSRSTSTSS
eukprot:4535913-Prymnesium_polylepis.1